MYQSYTNHVISLDFFYKRPLGLLRLGINVIWFFGKWTMHEKSL